LELQVLGGGIRVQRKVGLDRMSIYLSCSANRQREAKSHRVSQFTTRSHERERSLFGEHCSVVRLNEGSMLCEW